MHSVPDCIRNLAALEKALGNSGLIDILHKDRHSLGLPKLDAESNVMMLRITEQIVEGDVAKGSIPKLSTSEEYADRHRNAVKKELAEGRTVGFGLRLIWGQKKDHREKKQLLIQVADWQIDMG